MLKLGHIYNPKAVGIWERGWNSTPDWPTDEAFAADFNRFYSILVKKEMPAWDKAGTRPGIVTRSGSAYSCFWNARQVTLTPYRYL